MNFFTPGLITAIAFFILSFASGIWLTHLGKPLNILILTLHKLISIVAAILTILAVFELIGKRRLSSQEVTTIAGAIIFFIVLIGTGAVLSDGKPGRNAFLVVHKFAPILAALCSGAAVFFLSGAW